VHIVSMGYSEASQEEIEAKSKELAELEETLHRAKEMREDINQQHSTAQDNDNKEAEAELLADLEQSDSVIGNLKDMVKEYAEWFLS